MIALPARRQGAVKIRAQLEAIQDHGLIYPQRGKVVYESIIESRYPDVNIPLLCDLLADNLFDWSAAIRAYEHGGKAL